MYISNKYLLFILINRKGVITNSFYNVFKKYLKLLKEIKTRDWEIRKELASRIKNQVKKIPVLNYFMDDTLDYVFHMEEVFKNLKKEGE